jgi:putative ABC transport system permease protein
MPEITRRNQMADTRIKKVLKDISQDKARAFVVILAIFIGIFGFSMMITTYSLLKDDITTNYTMTNPASAIMLTDQISDEQISYIRSLPGVEDAEARRIINGRIQLESGEWKSIELFIINDFSDIHLNSFFPEAGEFSPGYGEIVVERNAMVFLETIMGENYLFSLPGMDAANLTISGVVHDPGQAPSWMEGFGYGYLSRESLELFGETTILNRIYIQFEGNLMDKTEIRQSVEALRPSLAEQGIIIQSLIVPPPGEHPHETQMSSFIYIQQSVCILTLILSCFLIVNMINSIMSGQIRQIAVMKASGGTITQIAVIYLSIAMVLSLIAVIISVPAGLFAGLKMAEFMSYQLNFTLFTRMIPADYLLLIIMTSLCIPVLVSFVPVLRSSRISVKDGISDYGISAEIRTRIRKKSSSNAQVFLMSLRNTFRKKSRIILTLITLSLGGILFLSSQNITQSIVATIRESMETKELDILIRAAGTQNAENLERIFSETWGIESAEYFYSLNGYPLDLNGNPGAAVPISALSPDTDYLNFPLLEGEGIASLGQGEVIANHMYKKNNPDVRVGDILPFLINGREYNLTVTGIVRELPAGPTLYISLPDNRDIIQQDSGFNSIMVRTDSSNLNEIRLAGIAIESAMVEADISLVSLHLLEDLRISFENHMVMVSSFLLIVAILMVIVGGLGLGSTMGMNVMERRREIGIMKSFGATGSRILGIILIEGAILGLISWFIACLLSVPVSYLLGNGFAQIMMQTTLVFNISIPAFFIWLAVIIFFTVISGWIPGKKAAEMPVHLVLTYE